MSGIEERAFRSFVRHCVYLYLLDITHVTRYPRPSPSVFAECRWRYYWEGT